MNLLPTGTAGWLGAIHEDQRGFENHLWLNSSTGYLGPNTSSTSLVLRMVILEDAIAVPKKVLLQHSFERMQSTSARLQMHLMFPGQVSATLFIAILSGSD